ncbi:MAG: class I SAM-dependent methyltransferase [Deltaproteobacteria bacterium]|nr:class I SAM-dependent methyltransferase [Deltaproteobacteria bacterium]
MKSDFQKYQDFWEDEAQKNKDADQLYMTVGSINPEQHDLVGTILTTGIRNNGLLPHHKILDIGCGNGRLAEKLTEYLSEEGEYFGFDISATLIEASKAKISAPNFHFSLSEGETFPFPDNHFDFIVLFSVFTHLHAPTISSFLKEIHRLLKNTGVCLATVIINNDIDQDAGDIQRMKHNYTFIEHLTSEQGLVIDSVQQKWPQESADPAKVLFSDPEGSQSCLKIVKPDFPNIIRVVPKIFKSRAPLIDWFNPFSLLKNQKMLKMRLRLGRLYRKLMYSLGGDFGFGFSAGPKLTDGVWKNYPVTTHLVIQTYENGVTYVFNSSDGSNFVIYQVTSTSEFLMEGFDIYGNDLKKISILFTAPTTAKVTFTDYANDETKSMRMYKFMAVK